MRWGTCFQKEVLILVLMEDTLRVGWFIIERANPFKVLILVLMEDTLRVSVDKAIRGFVAVLILVLMEDTLRG